MSRRTRRATRRSISWILRTSPPPDSSSGSERLATSGSASDPTRLKEAQSINKSLSALADVIGALGGAGAARHVPYRNSTLTWLLKHSLGGNAKTYVASC